MIVVVMGVAGAGKTTIGEALARRLGWPFIDADDYHPLENIEKMRAGIPLDDGDRGPWLARLNALLKQQDNAVLACSALKQRYRERLAEGLEGVRWAYLKAEPELIRARMAARQHHYMPASLLESQLAALEPPTNAIAIDAARDVATCVSMITSQLN